MNESTTGRLDTLEARVARLSDVLARALDILDRLKTDAGDGEEWKRQ